MSYFATADDAQVAMWELWALAETSGVPWSYSLSQRARTDAAYRAWLAHEYVSRKIAVDPLDPPAVLGPSPLRPTIDQGELERDLDALGDFGLKPLCDFHERRTVAVGPGSGTNGDRPVPAQ